jgi:capsular exopolysaccharide synthesis family protein
LRRRWLTAIVLGLLGGLGGGALAWYLMPVIVPAKFTARTKLHIASKQPTILSSSADGATNFSDYQKTQAALVKSRLVLDEAVEDPRLAGLALVRNGHGPAVESLEKEIKVDFSAAPEIMTISLTGDNPEELAAVVDAVRDAYCKKIPGREREEAEKRLASMERAYDRKKEELEIKEAALRLPEEQAADPKLQERIDQLKKDLDDLGPKLRAASQAVESDLMKEKEIRERPISEMDKDFEAELLKDDLYVQLIPDVAKTAADLADAKKNGTEKAVQKFKAAADAAKKRLDDRRSELRGEIVQRLREKMLGEHKVVADKHRQERASYEDQVEKIQKEKAELEGKLPKAGAARVDPKQVAEVTSDAEALKKLDGRIKDLKMELDAPSRIRLLEAATATPNPDRRLLVAVGAGVAGALLLLFGVAWCEFRARRITEVNEVADGLGIPVIGTIPRLAGRARPRKSKAMAGDAGRGPASSESIDVARTVLVRAARVDGVRVVMATSAGEGEGKTMAASELAISLARGGFSTLLIDGDLHKPILHKLFGTRPGPGLNELLRGEAHPGKVIRETEWKGLSLLPAGDWDRESGRGLARGDLGAILAKLREEYEFIVVDSAPLLPGVDALVMGQHVDAVIFSVLRGVSRSPAALAACERAGQFQIRVLGAVVHGVEGRGSEALDRSVPEPCVTAEAPPPGALVPGRLIIRGT